MTKRIGNVTLTYLKKHQGTVYSDGDIENDLLALFSSRESEQLRSDILHNNPSWPMYYHLSPQRSVLVDWINFRKGASVLEVGAGCGAITEALVKNDVEVTALELSDRRALVNAHRNSTAENLSIIIGNLESLQTDQKFDYIVCVGVLEYAGTFIDSDTPYETFLAMLKSHLKDNGVLILAIENRLGLKYWAGAREDHTGGFFDSLNHYPQPKKVQTFGKQELKNLLGSSGLPETDFYFPFPDYKHPTMVFSESLTPSSEKFNFPLSSLPAPAFDQSRAHLFSEGLAMQSLEANHLFSDFSNSFLVFASAKHLPSDQPVFYRSNMNRKDLFRIGTAVQKDKKGELVVHKTALGENGATHTNSMERHFEALRPIFQGTPLRIGRGAAVSANTVAFDFVDGVTLDRYIFDQIIAGRSSAVLETIHQFIRSLERLPKAKPSEEYEHVFGKVEWPAKTKFVAPALVDCNFDNIIIDTKGMWNLIDYEWMFDFAIPVDFLISRALINFFYGHSEMLRHHAARIPMVELPDGSVVPDHIYRSFKKYFDLMPLVLEMENNFQQHVLGREIRFSGVSKEKVKTVQPFSSPVEDHLAAQDLREKTAELERSLAKTQADLTTLLSRYNKLRYRWRNRVLFIPKLGLRAVRKAKRQYSRHGDNT
jgi:2-polyprenyl-3-methyl-5-hydroxy-6-metoxy-1,4-benzoquinol methylase